jgi:hypothetical protein
VAPRQGVVYGVGALRAAARGDRTMWAVHRAALAHGIVPRAPAPVVAEAFRLEARGDRLADLLAGTDVEPLSAERARRLGELAARADTTDVAAVSLAEAADRCNSAVIGSRNASLRAVASVLGHDIVQHTV